MARPAGLEPAAPGLEVPCSIQVSCGRSASERHKIASLDGLGACDVTCRFPEARSINSTALPRTYEPCVS
jgi:hypothetical protein